MRDKKCGCKVLVHVAREAAWQFALSLCALSIYTQKRAINRAGYKLLVYGAWRGKKVAFKNIYTITWP